MTVSSGFIKCLMKYLENYVSSHICSAVVVFIQHSQTSSVACTRI